MKIYDLAELATRNLRESILRNSLTTLGIAVGVSSLVAMLSLGIGLQQLATRRLRKTGLFDTVVVSSRRDLRSFSREQESSGPAPAESPALDELAREKIAHIAGEDDANLRDLSLSLLGKELTIRYGERVAAAASTAPSSPPASEQSGTSAGAAYSVVSRQLTLKIVGISDLDPDSLRGPLRARVFIPLKLAESLHVMQPNVRDTTGAFGSTPTYATLSVRVRSPKQVQAIETAIKKMGFNTFSIVDATRSMRQFFAVLDLFLGIFGSLALAVASIGIVNTLVMAILERRREIGIMKAIGASDVDVKKLFFAEAGAMGVLGGAVGVALGWAMGRIINLGTDIYLRRQDLPPEQIWFVPWWLVLGAIGFAILVSLISGLYPASRAARLDPVEALRYQ
jgi:putative ABC transport system permease protein